MTLIATNYILTQHNLHCKIIKTLKVISNYTDYYKIQGMKLQILLIIFKLTIHHSLNKEKKKSLKNLVFYLGQKTSFQYLCLKHRI